MENYQDIMREFAESIKKQAEIFTKVQDELIKQALLPEKIVREIQDSFKKLPKSGLDLSKFGWYLSLNMTPAEINILGEKTELQDIKYIDSFMVDHIQKEKDHILKLLIKRYPERKDILLTGFKCHNNKDFNASVPIFLSQADGICIQITNLKLYNKKDKKPEVSKFVDQLKQESIPTLLLQPLTIITSISSDKKKRAEYKGLLNRHEVLHGISLDYGTEINSCKSISILYFVGEILWYAVDLKKNNA